MPECFLTIDRDDWNVVSIAPQQGPIAFNIYLLKSIFVNTLSTVDSLFSFFAKVAARAAVNNHVGFCGRKSHESQYLIVTQLKPGFNAINSRVETRRVRKEDFEKR